MAGADKREISENAPFAAGKSKFATYAALALAVLFAASSGVSIFLYKKYSEARENPQKVIREESEKLVKKAGRLIVLPEGEIPTIATVTDVDKLKEQPFLSKTKVGATRYLFLPTLKDHFLRRESGQNFGNRAAKYR